MRIKVWMLGLVLLGLAALVLFYFLPKPLDKTAIALPDGSRLSIEKISVGTNHTFFHTTNLQQKVISMLPLAFARKRINFPFAMQGSERPSLMIWLRNEKPGWPLHQQIFTLKDDSGFENEAPTVYLATTLPSGAEIRAVQFLAFPRHQKTLKLSCYVRDKYFQLKKLGEFVIPNPGADSKEPPVWMPQTLPATNSHEKMEVILDQLVSGLPTASDSVLELKGQTLAIFSVLENGLPSLNLEPTSISLEDSSGNFQRAHSYAPTKKRSDKKLEFYFRPSLWPSNPIWKLNVDFARVGDFPESSLMIVTNLALKRDGGRPELNIRKALHGHTVTVKGVGGMGSSLLLHVNISPEPTNLALKLVSFTDELGKNVYEEKVNWSKGDYYFFLNFTSSSTNGALILALHPPKTFQFVAKPVFQTNSVLSKP